MNFQFNPQTHRSGAPATTSATDPLFAKLDGRCIPNGSTPWTVRVLGIHARGGEFWVQCAAPDRTPSGPLLRLSARATAQHVLAALEAWAALAPSVRPDTVDVMRLAQ